MAENSPEKLRSSNPEKQAENSELKNLERAKSPEKKLTAAEREKGELDLAKRGEAAEKKLAAEKEKRELKLNAEEEKVKQEKQADEEPEARSPLSYSPAEKKTVYKKQIKNVQAQLPRGSRTFSKVIHNPAVEKVSDAAAKTVFRPSALIGGSITGLILGLGVYLVARYYGYTFPTLTLVLFLIVGALVGVVVEFIVKLFVRPKQDQ